MAKGSADYKATGVHDLTPMNSDIQITRDAADGTEALLVAVPLALRSSISIQVDAAATASIFIGPPTVTIANGWEIEPGGSYDADLGPDVVLEVITDGTSVAYQVMELG